MGYDVNFFMNMVYYVYKYGIYNSQIGIIAMKNDSDIMGA